MSDDSDSATTGEHRLYVHPEPEDSDWSDQSSGHPLLATVVGAIILILTVLVPHVRAMLGGQYMIAYLIASTLGGGVIVWLVALAVTIRKSAIGWKIGSLVALTFVSACVTLGRLGSGDMTRQDASTVALQINQALENGDHPADIKVAAGTGAVSRMNAVAMEAVLADRNAFNAEAAAAGLDQVLSGNGLAKASPVLRHCGTIDALVARTEYYDNRFPAHRAAADAIGNKAVQDGEISAATVAAFDRGAERDHIGLDRGWLLTGQLAAEAGAICRILAETHWVMQHKMILFTNRGDLARANAHWSRISQINAELDALQRSARDRAKFEADQLSRQ